MSASAGDSSSGGHSSTKTAEHLKLAAPPGRHRNSPRMSQDPSHRHGSEPPDSRTSALVAIAIAIGLALRAWEAAESSLWLDELHTLSHASLPTVSAVAANVGKEFHLPLFFVFVHMFGAWEQGAWLRAIPVLSSLLVYAPLLAFARTAKTSSTGIALVALLFACLPYDLHYSTDLRPYAWLMLFSAGAAWAAFREGRSHVASFVLFAVCVALGMWTHRLMAVAVFSIGVARLFVRKPAMLHLGWLVLAGVIAIAPSVPWMLSFAGQATDNRFHYQDTVGGYHLRRVLVMEFLALPTRLFVPYLGALGGAWQWIAKLGAFVFFGSVVCGVVSWWFNRRAVASAASAPLRALAIFAAVDFVLVTGLSIYTWDRMPLQYYAPIAWALPLLVVQLAPAFDDARRAKFVRAIAGSALALGIAQAGGQCSEDMRAAVATAREAGQTLEQPLYSALLSQPSLFEQVLPYRAYGRDLEFAEPEQIAVFDQLAPPRPLVVIRRGTIPLSDADWKPLLAGRKPTREIKVDSYLTVFVLERSD
jgi:hypothetical protein